MAQKRASSNTTGDWSERFINFLRRIKKVLRELKNFLIELAIFLSVFLTLGYMLEVEITKAGLLDPMLELWQMVW